MAIEAAHQVQAGIVESQGSDFQSPSPKRAQAQIRSDGFRAQHGLGAVAGIVSHNERRKHHSRTRQQLEFNIRDGGLTTERVANRRSYPVAVAVDVHKRGQKQGEQNNAQRNPYPKCPP